MKATSSGLSGRPAGCPVCLQRIELEEVLDGKVGTLAEGVLVHWTCLNRLQLVSQTHADRIWNVEAAREVLGIIVEVRAAIQARGIAAPRAGPPIE